MVKCDGSAENIDARTFQNTPCSGRFSRTNSIEICSDGKQRPCISSPTWRTRRVLAAPIAAFASFDEEKIPLDKVPKAVIAAAKKKFPAAKIDGAAKEVEKGKTTYELMMTVNGKKVERLV